MAEKIVLDAEIKTGSAEGSVKSLKTQLKEAQAEVAKMADKFGETSIQASQAAKKAADLKDRIGDAKALTDAFSPDRKFAAIGAAMQGVAGGFAAVQGAMGLMGGESEEVQKQLLKVQSAMALVQGLNAVTEAKDAFKNLGSKIKDTTAFQTIYNTSTKIAATITSAFGKSVNTTSISFKALRGAIIATGIGALVIGIGMLIEKLDLFSDATSEAAEAEQKLREEIEKHKNALDEVMRSNQDYIDRQKQQIINDEKIKDLSINAKDNQEKINKLKKENLDIEIYQAKVELATKEGYLTTQEDLTLNEKVYRAEQEKTRIDKEANFKKEEEINNKRVENLKQQIEAEKQANLQIRSTKQEIELLNIKDEKERAKKKLQFDYENQIIEIVNTKASHETQLKLATQLKIKLDLELAKLTEEQNKEEEKRQEEFQNQLQEKKTDTALLGIKDEFKKKRIEQNANYFKELQDLKNNEKLKEEEKFALLAEIQKNNAAKLREIDKEEAKKRTDIENETFNMQFQARMNALKNQGQRRLEEEAKRYQDEIDKQLELLNNKEINEADYNARREAAKLEHETKLTEIEKTNSDERQKKAEEEHQKKVSQIKAVGDAMTSLSDVVGKETAVGKALGIAQATINTYLGATEVLRAKSVLPEPAGTIVKLANVAAIIASGIKSVKAIASTKVPGSGGGGSMPSASVTAPIAPQMSQTALNQQMINQMGNAASRAFVLESDVSGNQERIRRLNRAARIN